MNEIPEWINIAINIETPSRSADLSDKNMATFFKEVARLYGTDNIALPWCTIRTSASGYVVSLTTTAAIDGQLSNTADQVVSLFKNTFKLLEDCSLTSVTPLYFQSTDASNVSWVVLKILVSPRQEVIFPRVSTSHTQAALAVIEDAIGIVSNKVWSNVGTDAHSLSFSFALPDFYLDEAVERCKNPMHSKILTALNFSPSRFTVEPTVAQFVPHMMAKAHTTDGCDAIEYTVENFCYAISPKDAPVQISDMSFSELWNIVKDNLIEVAPMLGVDENILSDDHFRAVKFEFDVDSLSDYPLPNSDNQIAQCCTITFAMNIDVVGPFTFGKETGLQDITPEIIGRSAIPLNYEDGMSYNYNAWGDLLQRRLASFGHEYGEHQTQIAIFYSLAQDTDTLNTLCETVAEFLALSSKSEFFPMECFTLQPVIDEDTDKFQLNVGFKTNDAMLVREFHYALNQLRLDSETLLVGSDSFSQPAFLQLDANYVPAN